MCTLYPDFTNVNILHNPSTIIKVPKLALIQFYYLIRRYYSSITNFPPTGTFLCYNPSKDDVFHELPNYLVL